MSDPDKTLEDEVYNLARLALQGTHADVEMYVHRLAYRHRKDALGARLASVDVVPAVSLRSARPAISWCEHLRAYVGDGLGCSHGCLGTDGKLPPGVSAVRGVYAVGGTSA